MQTNVETNERLNKDPTEGLKNLRKAINEIGCSLAAKQKRIAQAETAISRIHKWLDERGVPREDMEALLSPLDEELSKHKCVMHHL